MRGILVMTILCAAGAAAGEDAIDYAALEQKDAWLHHPIYGDPSFDAFERHPGNPVVRGAAPYEWPVNGFLFEDPPSGHWFLYVGEYCSGYAIKQESPPRCNVWRSADKGTSWERIGPIFAEPPLFEGEVSPATHAPDVSVLYADGRYHLCFDWATDNTTWENVATPPPDANSGVGYAWSERPEGPYQAALRPIATTREMQPLLGKYRRLYASTIIRRANDWLVLSLTDSGPNFGWALLGMTAAAPEGPYSAPALLLHPESARFHPPLLEFFPAFVHDGHIYAPSTSVAMNRNYQALFRVPIERALEPEAWELYQAGSLWHAEPVEHEYAGIWGQTFSGFVGADGLFNVMFPSRDSNGMGTINLASRPWATPYLDRGFVLSGHDAPSMAFLRRGGPVTRLEVELEVSGVVSVMWNARMPLGPNRVSSNATINSIMLTRYCGLELGSEEWKLVEVDDAGARRILGAGNCSLPKARRATLEWNGDVASLDIEGYRVWSGEWPCGAGLFGLIASPRSHARVSRFALSGARPSAPFQYLYLGALLGAAQDAEKDWDAVRNPSFYYGAGAVSKTPGVLAKWDFAGRTARLYSPRGPDLGTAEISIDSDPAVSINFNAPEWTPSQPVYMRADMVDGPHALTIRATDGFVPIDLLEVE